MPELEEWAELLKKRLERRTGRKDIEVTIGPWRAYDVKVSAGSDNHPIVDFYSPIRYDRSRLTPAMDYAVDMIQNWEANKVLHEKAKRDSERFYHMLKARFPDMELDYGVIDSETHFVRVKKEEGKLIASFDLWPKMTDADVERIADYIRERSRRVLEEGVSVAGIDYE